MVRTLGLLTLGQTPRADVTPTLQSLLGKSVRILERGGLDGLSAQELAAVTAREGESQLETRLRSGAAIALSKKAVLPRLIEAGQWLARESDALLLLCSGEFPALAQACPGLIQPIHILRGVISAVARNRVLGLVGPESDLAAAPAQWAPHAAKVICAAASPYEALDAAVAAGISLAGRGAEVILMDDMGFNEQHRTAVSHAVRCPVICATTVTARVLCEVMSCLPI
jgi:protein AroM